MHYPYHKHVNCEDSRENLVHKARIAEQAERYGDMVCAMKLVTMEGQELSSEERNLLSVAYKNEVGARRTSVRVISSFQAKEGDDHKAALLNTYRLSLEKELITICRDALDMLEKYLMPNASNTESKVFYLKMKGDYNRYIAEAMLNEDKDTAIQSSHDAYQLAFEKATMEMAPTNPIRLGVVLNFSVYFYEMCGKQDKACQLVREALSTAIDELDTLDDDSYKDSKLIIQLLHDNLTLWTAEDGPE